MADGLNRVMLLGNLGVDPDLRTTPNGQAVLKLRLATTETYFDKDKVKKENTQWHSVVVWGKRAEGLARFLTKGMRLFIEGKLSTRSWEKDGRKQYATEIVATNVIVASSGKSEGGQRSPQRSDPTSDNFSVDDDLGDCGGFDVDVPF